MAELPREQRWGLLRVLATALAGWPLESLHYAELLLRHNAAPWAQGLSDIYPRVLLGSSYLVLLRFLALGALAWVSLWVLGRRIDSRLAMAAAAWTGPAIAAAALLLTPLAPGPGAGLEELQGFLVMCYSAEAAAAWAALAAGLARAAGLRGPVEVLRGAAAAGLASLLVYATPAAAVNPAIYVYSIVLSSAGQG